MICQDCKDDYHEVCKGATHCPCQHRVPTIEVPLKSGGVLVLRATTEEDQRPTLAPADVDKVIVEVPPEVADAIDLILAHPEFLVHRERPQRKPLVELVADGTYATEAEVTRAALRELTQLSQEMGLE